MPKTIKGSKSLTYYMQQLTAVFTSDGIDRYGNMMSVSALTGALWEGCEIGTPYTIGHDVSRIIGWCRPLAIHFEPHLSRVFGIAEVVETNDESKQIVDALNSYLNIKLKEDEAEIEELMKLISPNLKGEETAIHKECVSLIGPGLATRIFPEIFKRQDKDNLIPIDELTFLGPDAFQIGELAFFPHVYFRRSHSRLNALNISFLKQIQKLADNGIQIKIALDPDMVGLASTYKHWFELEYWWGPKFDDDLALIPVGVTKHVASKEDRLFHGISATEFWWQSRDKEHIFEVEELRDIPSISDTLDEYGCRYAHSIVQEDTNEIIHLDGAVRIYSKTQMAERLKEDIAHAGRHTHYTKLWRTDGNITTPEWKRLLSDYFRDNHLIGEYLGASPEERKPNITENNIPPKSIFSEYVPYSMNPGMGVRVALSYHPWNNKITERSVVPQDTLSSDHKTITIVESVTMDLRKVHTRLGETLSIPDDTFYVRCEDGYVNLPLILHSKSSLPKNLEKTLDAIKMLVSAWKINGHVEVASFSFGFPCQDREVRISVLGHIIDLEKWLSSPLSKPPLSQEEIEKWSDKVSSYLKTNFSQGNDYPSLSETLMTSGILLIKRRSVDKDKIINIRYENGALRGDVIFKKDNEELTNAFIEGKIGIALATIIIDSKCSRCERPYIECNCCKELDNDVIQEISKSDPGFIFWTDRPIIRQNI